MTTAVLLVSGLVLLVVALAMVVTALVARRVGRVSVVDVTWGLALLAAALVCAVVGPLVSDPDPWRSWVLVALVAVSSGRLSWHLWRRSRGHGEDPRYTKLLGGELNDGHVGDAIRKVFVVQGVAVWLVSLPLQAAAVTDVRWTWPGAGRCGCLGARRGRRVWGDSQLSAYRALPRDQRPEVLDTGLWRYPRHRTTSATPACGGASGSPADWPPAGCRHWRPWWRRSP